MQVSDKLTKALTEVKYLNADNVSRYRCIMRIFFENYEKLRYWLYQEDVYAQMTAHAFFADYTPEQCQQDLSMLVEWKNLNTIQDTRKVSSIEEFKNKKFRYQMSEYSVEIERLVLRLENLLVEGASLEPTLLERIRIHIARFPEMAGLDVNQVYTWWNDLNNDSMATDIVWTDRIQKSGVYKVIVNDSSRYAAAKYLPYDTDGNIGDIWIVNAIAFNSRYISLYAIQLNANRSSFGRLDTETLDMYWDK